MAIRIEIRHDTTENWAAANPILAAGEPALDESTGFIRYGNGVDHYLDLPDASSASAVEAAAYAAQAESSAAQAQEIVAAIPTTNDEVMADVLGTPTAVFTTQLNDTIGAAVSRLPGASGLVWAFPGDSITNGSSASNFSYSYAPRAVQAVGGLVARRDFIESGVPGDTSAGLLARIEQTLDAGAQAVCIMIGTNDAGLLIPLATFISNVTAIVNMVKSRGIPVVLCTVPPRGASTSAAIQQAVVAENAWIRQVGPSLGCEIADVYSVLVDVTSGFLLASYDSGDGTHPTNGGHYAMSVIVAAAMAKICGLPAPFGLITTGGTPSPSNIVSDPLALVGVTKPSAWFEQPGGTGTAPVYSLVADTSGILPAGKWAQMDFDATASGGTRRLSTNALSTALWSPGDTVVLTGHLQIVDVTGTWVADAVSGASAVNVNLINQSGVSITQVLQRFVGTQSAPGVYNLAPFVWPIVIPAGTTALNIWVSVNLPTGRHITVRTGCLGAINATTLSLNTLYNWATDVSHVPA